MDWIKCVNEDFCCNFSEIRNKEGNFQAILDTVPHVFHHPTRDLSVHYFQNESSAIDTLAAFDVPILEVPDNDDVLWTFPDVTYLYLYLFFRILCLMYSNCLQKLEFHGHNIVSGDDDSSTDSNEDSRVSVPFSTIGNVYGRTEHQIFAKTKIVLPQGACGGPVMVSNEDRNVFAGLVEGIVPENHPNEDIRGLAVFLESSKIFQ